MIPSLETCPVCGVRRVGRERGVWRTIENRDHGMGVDVVEAYVFFHRRCWAELTGEWR